jgi:hypothetical protein
LLKHSGIRFALQASETCSDPRPDLEKSDVPTLTRLLLVLILLGALGYGAVYSLAYLVEPREREIEVRVKKEGFGR